MLNSDYLNVSGALQASIQAFPPLIGLTLGMIAQGIGSGKEIGMAFIPV